MRVRHLSDVRTLFWAFVLFPLPAVVACLRPEWTPALLPMVLYLAYCAGVLVHNHNHSPVFHGRRANAFYAIWLSVFYGFPAFSWIPTHNQNHHRFINGEGDITSTLRVSHEHTFWNALTFPLLSSYWQTGLLSQFIADARAHRPKLYRTIVAQIAAVAVAHAGALALMVAVHGFGSGSLVYAAVLGLPALFAPWSMMFTNYVQHVGCDPESRDDHSRNFVSPFWNWLVFDAGYHTVHHEQPGVHWSRYRALHAERAAKIAPSLNQSSIFAFCFQDLRPRCFPTGYRDAARVTRVSVRREEQRTWTNPSTTAEHTGSR